MDIHRDLTTGDHGPQILKLEDSFLDIDEINDSTISLLIDIPREKDFYC